MGEHHHSLPRGIRAAGGDPPWATVAATTLRLWLERHHRSRPRPSSRRQRGVMALCVIAAMALGALLTLILTQKAQTQKAQTHKAQTQQVQAQQAQAQQAQDQQAQAQQAGKPTGAAQNGPTALQIAAATRTRAATWIAEQVLPSVLIGCDPLMCQALQAAGVSASRLSVVQPSAPDPLGVEVVVATPALRSQFGPRLAAVYAPLVMASFGAGAQRIDVRYVAPGGTAAFEASLGSAARARVQAGQQLLRNQHVQASPQARAALLAGHVDPRLLVTLGLLAHEMPLRLVAFDDSSPGASSQVPLRGAEIGASAPAGLAAMLAFLAQQTAYQPSIYHEAKVARGQVVTVQYDAPGPLGLNGP